MFTCSSGVSFLRNFPKNRVHDAASHSLFCLHFRCFTPFRWCVGESFRFLHCSLFCVWWWWCCRFLFLFLLLCIGVIRGGLFCMVSERILTNFECVYFLFPSKIVFFLCALFLSLCVCLKTQNATPKCTQPNPSAPKGSLILLHALDLPLFACANSLETSKFDNSTLFVNCDSLNLVWKMIIFWINSTEIGENW